MNRLRVLTFLALVGMILTVTTAPSLAASICIISNETPLTFDASDSTDRPRDGRASFVVTCARPQTTMVSLLYSHRMTSATKGAVLTYDLYARPDHSAIWGSGADGVTVPIAFSAGHPTTMYIYARIPAHQSPAPGLFHDNIEIVTMP